MRFGLILYDLFGWFWRSLPSFWRVGVGAEVSAISKLNDEETAWHGTSHADQSYIDQTNFRLIQGDERNEI